jgi:hypothetical protein
VNSFYCMRHETVTVTFVRVSARLVQVFSMCNKLDRIGKE